MVGVVTRKGHKVYSLGAADILGLVLSVGDNIMFAFLKSTRVHLRGTHISIYLYFCFH